jgi:hypothetical protein
MRLQRVARMDAAEIGVRARQQAAKWWGRVAPRAEQPAPPDEAALARFRAEAGRRFFAGASSDRVPALLVERAPAHGGAVVGAAERALAGRFDLLGYRGLSFGQPIDWHLDPVSGRRAPLVHWSRIDPLDVETVGDNKVTWELSRHQWLVAVAQAYRLTGDERHAQAALARISDWLDANPYGMGIHWASSLEAALRLMSWCWTLVLLRSSSALTAAAFARVRAAIEEHAGHVERFLSHYFSPNTHLTGEALGLFYAAALFPDLPRATRWSALAAAILAQELERQVMPDGVYFEQSTCYQRYTAEIGLHFVALCARGGRAAPPVVTDRLQALLDFLVAVRGPDGAVPAIGDADGGWLLPLAPREPGDLRGTFAVAAAAFGRADYAWAAGEAAPELMWMLGEDGLAAFDALDPRLPAAPPSRLFELGGYAVMRDGWAGHGHQLIFDAGPLGCRVSGGHGHADLLSIQCCAFGRRFLADPGTGDYADPLWRRYFRGSAAHSTVTVDGRGQAEPAGAFSWRERPEARLRAWVSNERLDVAEAEHHAYARPGDPVRHRRRVLFLKPRCWVVVDDLEGRRPHTVEVRFQFAPDVDVRWDGVCARAIAGGRALVVRSFATEPLRTRLVQGALQPVEGWMSPDYGWRVPAPVLVHAAAGALPLRIVTLLFPCADADAPAPVVSAVAGEAGRLVALRFDDSGETVNFGG